MQKPVRKQNYSAAEGAGAVDFVVPHACAGLRLDQALARLLPEHSRSRLTKWVRESRVSVEGRAAAPSDRVWGGERLHIEPVVDPQLLAHLAEAIPLDVVHEDEALIVI